MATPIIVSEDDGIRPDVTVEVLGSLKAIFKKGGSTTAGNASQVCVGVGVGGGIGGLSVWVEVEGGGGGVYTPPHKCAWRSL